MFDEELLICPYCRAEQYNHEPDEISATMCHTTCERCGEEFWYAVTVTRAYTSYKDDKDSADECDAEDLDD